MIDDSAAMELRKGIGIKPSVTPNPRKSLLVSSASSLAYKSQLIETGKVSEGSLGNGDQWMVGGGL